MTRIASLWAAIVTGVLSTFVIPAVAWADQGGVTDELRKSPKIGFGGILCAIPCLLLIVGIVVVVYIVMQKRKR